MSDQPSDPRNDLQADLQGDLQGDLRGDDELDPMLCQMALADRATGRRIEGAEDTADDRLLDGFRHGTLAADPRRKLVGRLRREPALRRRLATRAGVAPAPPPEVRARILAKIAPAKPSPRRRAWLALATALVVALGVTLLLPPSDLPPEVAYSVEVRGIATSRDPSSEPALAEAFAGTTVRIVARPELTPATPLELGLYRLDPGRLARVAEAAIAIERHGGAVTLSAKAGDLIAGEPGVHTLYLAVARPDDLPDSMATKAGERPEDRLAGGGRRRVYSITVRLLPEPTEDSPYDGGTMP